VLPIRIATPRERKKGVVRVCSERSFALPSLRLAPKLREDGDGERRLFSFFLTARKKERKKKNNERKKDV
jgi:hypothetical protein|tara:strand:- start:214 stop:423 length:210 start_codon:yes stop_codon:yes gene_type:complete